MKGFVVADWSSAASFTPALLPQIGLLRRCMEPQRNILIGD